MRALALVSAALAGICACAASAMPVSSSVSSGARSSDPSGAPVPAAVAFAVAPGASAPRSLVDASPVGGERGVEEAGVETTARGDAAPASSAPREGACNEQEPQDFLVRGVFLKSRGGNDRAIQWRTDEYGYVKGYGRPGPHAEPPSASVVTTTFMGLPVKMHRKVVPALACVERAIEQSCAEHPYAPHALAGIRYRNTYRGGEVTNHMYGIAIDVDPDINTCCGCVAPWNKAPACTKHSRSEYDRMAMPECWVHAFERYGFYWLGHDVLRDTMHFEFLGDPDRILKR
jgi:hypothetical protein